MITFSVCSVLTYTIKYRDMTIKSFCDMPPKSQMDHLKQTTTLIHKIIKGNFVISLYWSKDIIYEVLSSKNNQTKFEIKCYDRFNYVLS